MSDFVSIVVPVLNEEHYLRSCLQALSRQVTPETGEIIVVDGRSSDRSREIARDCMRGQANIRLIDNPARLQSAGVNSAARQADRRATVLIRADAHASYPTDFVANCVAALRRHQATSVVVPMLAAGRAGFQRAAAFAQNDRLGNGGSSHRRLGRSRFVEHGHHAAFDLAFFLRVGGYDESFSHNEDAELDLRALVAGGSIWMCVEAAMTYYPRTTIAGLVRQYRNHGAGRARTLLLHRCRPRLRQLAPVCVVLWSGFAVLAAPVTPWLLPFPLAYVLICCVRGVASACARRDPSLLAVGPALVAMHLAWGFGFLARLAGEIGRGCFPIDPTSLRQKAS